jgi:hypothetical protein
MFDYKSDNYLNIPLTPSFCKFKNLEIIRFNGVINSIPKCVSELKKLKLITLKYNKNLTYIPEEIFLLPDLDFLLVDDTLKSQVDEDKINEKREILGLPTVIVSFL